MDQFDLLREQLARSEANKSIREREDEKVAQANIDRLMVKYADWTWEDSAREDISNFIEDVHSITMTVKDKNQGRVFSCDLVNKNTYKIKMKDRTITINIT